MGLPALFYDGRENPPHLEIWIEYFCKIMSLNSENIYDKYNESKETLKEFNQKEQQAEEMELRRMFILAKKQNLKVYRRVLDKIQRVYKYERRQQRCCVYR